MALMIVGYNEEYNLEIKTKVLGMKIDLTEIKNPGISVGVQI
jgi:hypothetical protein